VREQVLLFGPGKSLAGVVTEPSPEARRSALPAVVLLNAGLVHRVGPNRLHVRLARRLAAAGLVVVRFDLSGIGDSRPTPERSGFAERAVAEARACLDLLASTRGATRFVAGGLCSGADNALVAAGDDPRIVGLALLDPVSAPSAGQLVDSYRGRFLRPASWVRLLTGRSEAWTILARRLRSRIGSRPQAAEGPAAAPTPGRSAASPGELMRRFTARGGSLCLVYSEGNPAHYHYRTVLRRQLEGVPAARLRVEVVRETDHVFTPLDAQGQVIDALCDWAESL
jgi:alpha-beta hydrolase superfamily lysophospholipase